VIADVSVEREIASTPLLQPCLPLTISANRASRTETQPLGDLFLGGAAELEEDLPDIGSAVVIRLRDRNDVGSTFVRVVDRYAKRAHATDRDNDKPARLRRVMACEE
jgi:hypothetical protein